MHTVSDAGAGDRIESHVWRIAGVVILGMIMSILDTTIVNVALHSLGQDLHASISETQWVVTGLPARARRRDPRHRLGLDGASAPSACT